MRAGDVFHRKDNFGGHFFVVISDPQQLSDFRFPEFVFLVMFSSREDYKEDACVLKKDDISFITHDTVIDYKIPPAMFVPLLTLQKLQDEGILTARQAVSDAILKKVRMGYSNSKYQRDDVFQFLYRQKVID